MRAFGARSAAVSGASRWLVGCRVTLASASWAGESLMTEDAWVKIPSEADLRALMPEGGDYDFGFLPAMARLVMAHPRIGLAFGRLFGEIMFAPGALTRRERELVAAVAASAQDCFY